MFPQEISIFLRTSDGYMQNSIFRTDTLFHDERQLPRERGVQILPIHALFLQEFSPAGKLTETFPSLFAFHDLTDF